MCLITVVNICPLYCINSEYIFVEYLICSLCYEGAAAVISTLSMVLRAIAAWKQHQALLAPINASSVGGRTLLIFLLICVVCSCSKF